MRYAWIAMLLCACTDGNPFLVAAPSSVARVDLGPVRGDAPTLRKIRIGKPIQGPARVDLVDAPSGAVVPRSDQFPAAAAQGTDFELEVEVVPDGGTRLEASFTVRFTGRSDLALDVDVHVRAEVEQPAGLEVASLDFGDVVVEKPVRGGLVLRNPNRVTPVEVLGAEIDSEHFTVLPDQGAGIALPDHRFWILIEFHPPGLGPVPPALATIRTSLGTLTATLNGTGVLAPFPEEPGPAQEPGTELESETAVYYRSGSHLWKLDPDTGERSDVISLETWQGGPGPYFNAFASEKLHDGERWFLTARQLGETLSDGSLRTELIAKTASGREVWLWDEAGALPRISHWYQGDAVIAFNVKRPAAGVSAVLRAPVDWSSGEPELGPVQALVERGGGSWFDLSPDGKQLVFSDTPNFPRRSLYVKDLETGVTTLLGHDRWWPRWSRDGNRIAFTTGVSGFYQGSLPEGLHTVDPDGSNLFTVAVAGQGGETEWPWWSPDGKELVFDAREGNSGRNVLRVSASGGPVVNLTAGVAEDARVLGWWR